MFDMTRKWIITGGCGFVGSNLAAALLEGGDEVVVLDSLFCRGSERNLEWLRSLGGRFQYQYTDTRNREDMEAVFADHGEGLFAVAHLAGQVAMTTSLERPRLDFETNALGALNVLEAVRKYAPGAVVLFSSTNKVYGDLPYIRCEERDTRYVLPDWPNGLDESISLDFQSPYGCSKGAADQYMLDYHRMFGLKTIVFRHSSIYGGRQFSTYDQGWIGWFCGKAIEMEEPAAHPFTISGDGKQVRDVLHADDIVRCYLLAAEQIKECAGKAYNIGGGMGNSLSLLELFAMLEKMTGNRMKYVRLPWRVSDQKVFVADNSKARRDFGFEPQITKEEGLSRMLTWVRSL
jgi:CDP-paratose 2-epimerase